MFHLHTWFSCTVFPRIVSAETIFFEFDLIYCDLCSQYTVPSCSYFVSEIACQKNQKFGQTYVSSELVATHLCMFVLHFRTLQLTPRYKLSIYHSLWLEYTNFIQKLWDLFTQNLRFNSFWLEILNTSIWTKYILTVIEGKRAFCKILVFGQN